MSRLIDADELSYNAETCIETTDAFVELINEQQTVNAIPISVIEDIKQEIDERYDLEKQNNIYVAEGLEIAEIIIDKHIKVQNNDTTN